LHLIGLVCGKQFVHQKIGNLDEIHHISTECFICLGTNNFSGGKKLDEMIHLDHKGMSQSKYLTILGEITLFKTLFYLTWLLS
jgi:hypothetical protein